MPVVGTLLWAVSQSRLRLSRLRLKTKIRPLGPLRTIICKSLGAGRAQERIDVTIVMARIPVRKLQPLQRSKDCSAFVQVIPRTVNVMTDFGNN